MVLLQLGLPAAQLSAVSTEQRNTGHTPAERTPVLRVPQSIRHSRVTQARLHELIVAKLYESPPSTEAEVRQLMAKDARLTRALVWQSRHVLAFGLRMHRSVAARLLHTYTHPGYEQAREAWLSRQRGNQHKTCKPRKGRIPQRSMRQLDLWEHIARVSMPAACVAREHGPVDAVSSGRRKRNFGRAVGPGPHTYESVFGRRPYLVQLQLCAVGGIVHVL